MAAKDFPALPGLYEMLFLHIEPVSTIAPAFLCWLFPGAQWFYNELVPGMPYVSAALDPRMTVAIWQLANCYFLLGLISSLVFRAVRDALHDNPYAQERIVRASLTALAMADVTHIAATLAGLPVDIRLKPSSWNPMTHGNISFVIFLLTIRVAWLLGIGRKTYSKVGAVNKK